MKKENIDEKIKNIKKNVKCVDKMVRGIYN